MSDIDDYQPDDWSDSKGNIYDEDGNLTAAEYVSIDKDGKVHHIGYLRPLTKRRLAESLREVFGNKYNGDEELQNDFNAIQKGKKKQR